jgi:UDP-galactopyranose mutase
MSQHHADYVVVGSGITGATIARLLADAGRDVLVVDRRSHMGGNVHDFTHPSGIRIHTYGPHYFRTSSDKIWAFVNRFTEFHLYKAIVYSWVEGHHAIWPINKSYLRSTVGPGWKPERTEPPTNFEEACLAAMPRVIYERFVRGYTQKQWGVAPATLSQELAGRFDVREDDQRFFSPHKHQGIPLEGYASFMSNMLAGIPRILDCDYLKHRRSIKHRRKLIFTGPIDEFFGFRFGKLKYRAQKRVHEYHRDKTHVQPVGQVNNPGLDNGEFVRTLEWKHMMPKRDLSSIVGTVVTREYPYTPENTSEYEYPFPDAVNRQLYAAYRSRAATLSDTLICGRLGEYRYFDMDQAIARAFLLGKQLLDDADERGLPSNGPRMGLGIETGVAPS